MLTIACLSQKGGAGKSTLAQLIATSYAQANWKVKLADFNLKQKTSTDWAALRAERTIKPDVAAEACASVKQVLVQRDVYDLMVFDGRPDSDATSLDLARAADLIIIPSGVSWADLAPQIKFANELRAKGIERSRIRFAINQTPDSPSALEDAKGLIRGAGYATCETDIPFKVSYQVAQNSGRAINETAYPTLNERAEELAGEIIQALNDITKELAS